MSQASAPSDHYDNLYDGYKDHDVIPNYTDSSSIVPIVEAQLVLPEDWSAVTAEVVTIPIAQTAVFKRSTDAAATDSTGAAGYPK